MNVAINNAVLFVILVVVIAIGATVISDIGESIRSLTVSTVTNETLTMVNNTNVSLTIENIDSVTNCMNPYNGTIGTGNYTVYVTRGSVNPYIDTNHSETLLSASHGTNKWNCTFVYSRYQDLGYNATVKGGEGQKNISNYAPVIGTIIGAILIISIVGYFAVYRKG